MAINQTDILQSLSFLLGESTVPTSNIDDRKHFIQNTLEEIYRSYQWDWARTTATIAMSGGSGALPSNMILNAPIDVREVVSGSKDDFVFEQVSYESSDDFGQGDYKYWLDENAGTVNTIEGSATLTVRYQAAAPSINASISTPFSDALTVALGALRYVRIGENPEADIVQEESNFRSHLDQHIAKANRVAPRTRRRTKQSVTGHFTGQI
jgi:hypothetical protein